MTTATQNNILQPQGACGEAATSEFTTSLCEALLHTTNNDNVARAQAEQFMEQAKSQQGCLSSLLQIATSNEVSQLPF